MPKGVLCGKTDDGGKVHTYKQIHHDDHPPMSGSYRATRTKHNYNYSYGLSPRSPNGHWLVSDETRSSEGRGACVELLWEKTEICHLSLG